jgi:hypothetical protein
VLSERKMIDVAHALPEDNEADRVAHLRYWYGTVRPADDSVDNDLDEFPIVCWCGARQVRFSDRCAAVWHLRIWEEGTDGE